MGDSVDYKEFRNALDELARQREKDLESIRNIVTSQVDQLRSDMKAQHVSIRGTLIEQNVTIAGHVAKFLEMFRKHEEEDDAVKTRVTILEQTIERIKWIMGPVIVSFLAAWEAVRNKIVGK